MKPLGHYRLAGPGEGSLTRYIRDERATAPRRRSQPRLPGMEAAFIQEARTKFSKSVKRTDQLSRLLVSGHSNVKIGKDVRKGKLKGYWIYTLSLEERKTCPRSCQHWQNCYGNNMPFAKRIDHTDPAFLSMLEKEIKELCAKKKGVLIRLHALGDFYSVDYVRFWEMMLRRYTNLSLYGYTARDNGDEIGSAVIRLRYHWKERAMIRSSNGAHHNMATVSIGNPESCPSNAFICPEQTGKTQCCATCALCWSTKKNVAFLEH